MRIQEVENETHIDVRRKSSRPREVFDKLLETFTIERVLRVEFRDGTFDVEVREDSRS